MDVDQEKKIDTIEHEGIPPPQRQRILKDMKIIEILTDMLYYPMKYTKIYKLDELKEPKNYNILKIH